MSRRRATGPAEGSTLVEVLVAVTILFIGGASIMSGLFAAAKASDTNRKEVTVDAVVRNYAEVIKQQVQLGAYSSECLKIPTDPPNTTDPPFVYTIPPSTWQPRAGYKVGVESIQYFHSGTKPGTPGTFSSACPDDGSQLLTLFAKQLDGGHPVSLDVIVRKP
jgi:type II secretory pathway pseudopilin PulG